MTTIIDGYEPDPRDVKAILDGLFDTDDLADPTLMYIQATKMQALHTAVVDQLGQLRAAAVQQLCNTGLSYQQAADHIGLTKPRVQQLLMRARQP